MTSAGSLAFPAAGNDTPHFEVAESTAESMEVDGAEVCGVDLGGSHPVGGRRAVNHGIIFEYLITFYLIFKFYADGHEDFGVASDHGDMGKIQDLHVKYTDRDSRKISDAVELKHFQKEIRKKDFTKRKFCLRVFFESFQKNRTFLDSCGRLVLAANKRFDGSVADNFDKRTSTWFLEDTEMWALKDSSLLEYKQGDSEDDLRTFCSKLRVVTGLPEVSILKENILRRLGEMYGDRGFIGGKVKHLYLHIKDKFEYWYNYKNEYMTYEEMNAIVEKAIEDSNK